MYMSSFAYFTMIFLCVLIYALVDILVFGKRLEIPSTNAEPLTLRTLWGLFIMSIVFLMGLVGLRKVLWQFFGKEIVEIGPSSIKIDHQLLGFRRSKEYATDHIKDLRTFPSERGRFEWDIGAHLWNRIYGTIGFDYGAKTIRFASSLDMAEAKHILTAIQQRFPQYQSA